ncbi:glycosyltransferase WbsX family protein [Ulvibacter antarcticus]|uniref:Glycosyl transferase family WbsX n=1 Tax=Ulvibacter antarcticus TaxID=442714 RepID=A0A3L9YB70_9FLAO|nr:glycoside hydrolase family 99-like domain-containing protein [Ulvibacter antarcticus]RMA57976.1 glycosyl transferase family WbsX [Ulvibacter antarcticus]
MAQKDIQFLAYYLPQFHPIPENDKWWGKGFTEWANVTKAKPLFKGHYQPILPSELGFYDLRVPEVREQQATLAKEYGVDGFIYYQYWFSSKKMLLQRPSEEMLKSKSPDLPFCFCWANETWKGIWHGLDNPEVLIEQEYEGKEGYTAYFNYLLPFFQDSRYIKVANMPMFHIYRIGDIPDLEVFTNTFNALAKKAGFDGIYFVATVNADHDSILKNDAIYGQVGLDVFLKMRYGNKNQFSKESLLGKVENRIKKAVSTSNKVGVRKKPLLFDYADGVAHLNIKFPNKKYISCVFPNWDNSARSGKKSLIFKNADPKAWQKHLQIAVDELKENPENPKFVVIKSWNEWAEGNHLEPDKKFGRQWLEAVKAVKDKISKP